MNVKTRLLREPSFISRADIIRDIGRAAYEHAVKQGELRPIRLGNGKNSKIRVPYQQYKAYINKLINS